MKRMLAALVMAGFLVMPVGFSVDSKADAFSVVSIAEAASKKKSSGRAKTQTVKGHTKKSGKHVSSYKRSKK